MTRVGVLPLHAWRSNVAAAGETTAPSRIEQSVDVDGALLQLVRCERLRSVIDTIARDAKGEVGYLELVHEAPCGLPLGT
jgi:hypothetical protein